MRYHILLRIDANGATSTPTADRTATSNWKISLFKPPRGPSMNVGGRSLRIAGSTSRLLAFSSIPITAESPRCSKSQPSLAAHDLAKLVTPLIWIDR